jgi:hypothetical protein
MPLIKGGYKLNALSSIELPAALCLPRQAIALRRSARAPRGTYGRLWLPTAHYGILRRTYGGSYLGHLGPLGTYAVHRS